MTVWMPRSHDGHTEEAVSSYCESFNLRCISAWEHALYDDDGLKQATADQL